MNYAGFVRNRFGNNWVLARRTAGIIHRYGDDVKCVTQKQMRECDLDYRRMYGDPYDPARAQLYMALCHVVAAKHAGELGDSAIWIEIDAALDAERKRP